MLHTLGRLRADDRRWQGAKLPDKLHALKNVRRFDARGDAWSVTADQLCALADASKAKLPSSWYDHRIGVRVTMLGAPGVHVYAADTPHPLASRREGKKKVTVEVPSEVGGVTLLVTRRAPAATFAALHEPFENGKGRSLMLRPIAQTKDGLAVAVTGDGVNDRLMLRLAGNAKQPLTLAGNGESFTFTDYAYTRISAAKVEVTTGALKALKLRVGAARPKLIVNGKEAQARRDGEFLVVGDK
jgi:hypothetical protein